MYIQTDKIQTMTHDLPFDRNSCRRLAQRYHQEDSVVLHAVEQYSPEQFLRLFLTAHGMEPLGIWQTHTYARVTDSLSGRDHFFLIPKPFKIRNSNGRGSEVPTIRPEVKVKDGFIWIDEFQTKVRLQSIPHTTPFWYFHYDPNNEANPYASMTLNLKPACPEKCTLCAGAKTGRVNNGMDGILGTDLILNRIVQQHPETREQLESVAVVTGCFDTFESLTTHLREVRESVEKVASPKTFRVLEHNVATIQQYDVIVKDLGFEVFITLECFDKENRRIALNGNVGRKGRDSREFIEMMKTYADYLEARPELNKKYVRVTYLTGIDSLDTMETLFKEMVKVNQRMKTAVIVPWLSIFTPYADSMRVIQRRDFSLRFLIEAQSLARRYFGDELMDHESGTTADGYARGLF